MPHPQFDRKQLKLFSLRERANRVKIEELAADPNALPSPPPQPEVEAVVNWAAENIRAARQADLPVIMAFGAHAIKNGLGPIFIRLMERRWVTHLASNGASAIHDLEFALQGASSEDVRANLAAGRFGLWEETGRLTNLALAVGAIGRLGYGQAVGALIEGEGLTTPTEAELTAGIEQALRGQARDETEAGALFDLRDLIRAHNVASGKTTTPFPWKRFSVVAAAYRLGVPFTIHPGIGQDIIYAHPLNHCGILGRCAQRDFLSFCHSVSRLDGGVYLSIGSAIMSPMIYEKATSMANNVALRNTGKPVIPRAIVVNDLQPGNWDWSKGEPPPDHPAYYLRFCKTFARIGGEVRYASADNRLFLGRLCRLLG